MTLHTPCLLGLKISSCLEGCLLGLAVQPKKELELIRKAKDRLLILFLFPYFPELLSCFLSLLPQSLQGCVVIARFALCSMFVLVQHTIFGSKMVVNAFLQYLAFLIYTI